MAAGMMFISGLSCIVLSWLMIPLFAIVPRKFALLYSFGSLLIFFSSSFIKGYSVFLQYSFSAGRVWYTTAYLAAMICTLIAVFKHTYFLVMLCSILQMVALIFFVLSYIPGGIQGLNFAARYFGGGAIQV
jgi:hypothetical protein